MSVAPQTTWSTEDLLNATGGRLAAGDRHRVFAGIAIDSRRIAADEVFVAIRGERHDGHTFIGDVLAHGVRGLVTEARGGHLPDTAADATWVYVDDTLTALGRLARHHRRRCHAAVAAITGSNGKTTTRALTAAVLGQRHATLATVGNLNNEIGLPLTLLRLTARHTWAVVELGMNHPGEIGRLGAICEPDIGVITNIGPAHLEGLESLEGVMEAKGELLPAIRPAGTAVLNADDPLCRRLAVRLPPARTLWFGRAPEAQVRAADVEARGSQTAFTLTLPSGTIAVRLQLPGTFMVSNALAAAAVGHTAGLTPEEIKAGLESCRPVQGRLNLRRTANGVTVIDDTYNANPGSMHAAIRTLAALKAGSRGLLVAGDMRELGPGAAALHAETGALAARAGVARLYACGDFAADLAAGAVAAGMAPGHIFVGSKATVAAELKKRLRPDDWVLVKGSRAMGMEAVVTAILELGGGESDTADA